LAENLGVYRVATYCRNGSRERLAHQVKCLSFEDWAGCGRCGWMRQDGTCMNLSVNIDALSEYERGRNGR